MVFWTIPEVSRRTGIWYCPFNDALRPKFSMHTRSSPDRISLKNCPILVRPRTNVCDLLRCTVKRVYGTTLQFRRVILFCYSYHAMMSLTAWSAFNDDFYSVYQDPFAYIFAMGGVCCPMFLWQFALSAGFAGFVVVQASYSHTKRLQASACFELPIDSVLNVSYRSRGLSIWPFVAHRL